MKTFIESAKKRISVVVEGPETPGKLAFVMHGLGGAKEQPHIRAIIETLLTYEYTVVSWDALHTFGESDGGLYEDATISNYYADLEDVIVWAASQGWYSAPFVLCGHSLGGICTALYAEAFPSNIKGLAPIATVVSGKLSNELRPPEQLEKWEHDGIWAKTSHDGSREKRLKWSFVVDGMHYNLLQRVSKLTMPVLLVVGSEDSSTPLAQQQILYDALPGKKELHIVEGALHSFYEPHEREELQNILDAWLKKLS